MVLGTIIDWTIYRTLDLTVVTLWWITKKTGLGIYSAGTYITGYGSESHKEEIEEIELKKIQTLKEENKLLKEQNEILKTKLIHKGKMSMEAPF